MLTASQRTSSAPSVIEALTRTGPGVEVWWDASPLVFPKWVEDTASLVQDLAERAILVEQLRRLHRPEASQDDVVAGVTTNPAITLAAVQNDPARWISWLDEQVRANPRIGKQDLFWIIYKQVVSLGAAEFLGLFEASGYKRGYLSGQVDPRVLYDTDEMVRQAVMLHALSPNVMIKMPGTREGIEGVRRLTAMGIPTNATLIFVLSQMLAVGEAVQAGLAEARAKGVDLSQWRSVCTLMLGRFEEAEDFRAQLGSQGIELTESDMRWAGVAVLKKAYRLYKERGYPTKVLAAAVRPGPTVDGRLRIQHVEEFAGGDVVMTVPPKVLADAFLNLRPEDIRRRIDDDVPDEVMAKLLKAPYFVQGYDEQGIALEDMPRHPSFVLVSGFFSQATQDLEALCAQRIAHVTGRVAD